MKSLSLIHIYGAVQKKYAQFAAEASVQSSEREVLAMTAERDVEDCYKAEYMRRFEGEEFDGVISSVTQFGLYVELPNTVEGLVRAQALSENEMCIRDRCERCYAEKEPVHHPCAPRSQSGIGGPAPLPRAYAARGRLSLIHI